MSVADSAVDDVLFGGRLFPGLTISEISSKPSAKNPTMVRIITPPGGEAAAQSLRMSLLKADELWRAKEGPDDLAGRILPLTVSFGSMEGKQRAPFLAVAACRFGASLALGSWEISSGGFFRRFHVVFSCGGFLWRTGDTSPRQWPNESTNFGAIFA